MTIGRSWRSCSRSEGGRFSLPALARVACSSGLESLGNVPVWIASLGWFDTLHKPFGSAAVIQAQRDHFGAHTYERLDHPGVFHSGWAGGLEAWRPTGCSAGFPWCTPIGA